MFLICLIQKPAKMTHFKNNNKPSQIFNHNKESEGRPIYFFFYTLHLLAWPERHAQMPAICSSTSCLRGDSLESPGFPLELLVQADETPHCWQRQWMGADWELGCGGMCPSACPTILSMSGQSWLLLSNPQLQGKRCLKQGKETKDLQDSMGKHWASSLPSLLRGKYVFFFFSHCTPLCVIIWEKKT